VCKLHWQVLTEVRHLNLRNQYPPSVTPSKATDSLETSCFNGGFVVKMPRKPPIVKSGNAGNSSKSAPTSVDTPGKEAPPPLFPPGSKYPLSLLQERYVYILYVLDPIYF